MKSNHVIYKFAYFATLILVTLSAAAKEELLFDYSIQGENFIPNTFTNIDSPSHIWAIELGFLKQETSDLISVTITRQGKKKNIAIATRAIDVKWQNTQLGEIIILTHLFDTHQNNVYILYPQITLDGEINIDLLYSTTQVKYVPPCIKYPTDHVYWTVKKIYSNGTMIIHGEWNFTDPSIHGINQDYMIPLFYGYEENNK